MASPVHVSIVAKYAVVSSVATVRDAMSYVTQHQRYVSDLKKEFEVLVDLRKRVVDDVKTAEMDGEEIKKNVLLWLSQVDPCIQQIEMFFFKNEQTGGGGCLDFQTRYYRSRKAKYLSIDAMKLFQRLINYDQVSYKVKMEGLAAHYKNEIMLALKDENIKMVGVFGMGMTTTVRQVSEEEEGVFDKVVWLTVGPNPNYEALKQHLRHELIWMFANGIYNVLIVLDDVWKPLDLGGLGISPYLLRSGFCKIIMTSRDKLVLSAMGCEITFQLNALNSQDSWQLFKSTLGDDVDFESDPDLELVAKEITRKCAGLPITIVTIAKALRGKPFPIWKDQLKHRYRTFIDMAEISDEVYASFYLTHEHFWEVTSSIFFICSLFPQDFNIQMDHLMLYGLGLQLFSKIWTLIEARNRVYALVESFWEPRLLMNIGMGYDCVQMHSIIRDFARSHPSTNLLKIYSQADLEEWPELETKSEPASALSLSFKSIHHFPQGLHYPHLEILALRCGQSSPTIPADFFEGIKILKVLHLSEIHDLSLPKLSSICLLRHLRVLLLEYCMLTDDDDDDDLSLIGLLANLETLSFYGSNIRGLPLEIGQLTRLRMLNLSKCDRLTKIPPNVISRLSRLEILYMKNSFVEWGRDIDGKGSKNMKNNFFWWGTDRDGKGSKNMNNSFMGLGADIDGQGSKNMKIDELMSLSHLIDLEIHIPDIEYLPNDIILKTLIGFKISIGSRFAEEEGHQSSRVLKFSGYPLNDRVNILLKRAEAIYLDNIKDLGEDVLNADDDNFIVCRYLKVQNCVGEALINVVPLYSLEMHNGNFCRIESLEIIDSGLKFLLQSSFARWFVELQELKIRGCDKIEHILRWESSEESGSYVVVFPKLRSLVLSRLPSLTCFASNPSASVASSGRIHFFNNMVEFPSLEVLTIYGLDQLEVICDNQISTEFFPKLRVITVVNCAKIPTIGNTNLREIFSNLEELAFMNCMLDDFESVHRSLDLEEYENMLPKLNALTLWGHSKLMFMWNKNSFVPKFPNLKELELWNCNTLRYIFTSSTVKGFPCLQTLRVVSCSVIQVIDDGHREASNDADDDDEMFPQLKSLILEDLPHLTPFSKRNFVLKLDCLEMLIITQCPQMKTFTVGHSNTRGIGEMEMVEETETRINNIPSISFFGDEVNFPLLVTLKLSDIDSIQKIWDSAKIPTESFCLLRELVVQNCSNLVQVFSSDFWSSKRFPCLEELIVENCHLVREVFDLRGIVFNESYLPLPLGRMKRLSLIKLPSLMHFYKEEEDTPAVIGEYEVDNLNPSLFSCYVARHLVQLEVLEVVECKVKEIVAPAREEDANSNIIIDLSRVQSVKLKDLPNLVRFCSDNQSLRWSLKTLEVEGCPKLKTLASDFFNPPEKAVDDVTKQKTTSITSTQDLIKHEFAIATLSLRHLVKLKEIWYDDHHILVFNHLRYLTIHESDKLRTLFTPTIAGGLSQLQNLIVDSCMIIEEIISEERPQTKAVIRKIELPQLKIIELKHLPQLESFLSMDYILELPLLSHVRIEECPQLQTFSPRRVFAPNLDKVLIGDSLWEWKGDLESTIAHLFKGEVPYSKTEELHIIDPDELEKILDIELQYKAFRRLKSLHVEFCNEELRVFLSKLLFSFDKLEKINVGNGYTLEQLFNLEGLDFEDQDMIFTMLEELKLWKLPRLICIWNEEMGGYVSLKNLKIVNICQCGRLLNLFSPTITRDLQQLRELNIRDCEMMEEVVAAKEEGGNEDFQEICLPQLQILELIDLSNLMTFHSGNCAFELPHLHTLRVERCPRLKSLTPGFINTPKSTDIDGMSEETLNKKMVGFPQLNQLYLKSLNGLEEIWLESVTEESLTELQILEIDDCGKLFNVIPHTVLPRLEKLEKLAITNCRSLRKMFDLEVQIINVKHVGSDRFTQLNEPISTNPSDLVPDELIAVFENLQVLKLSDCYRLNNLFLTSIARSFMEFKSQPHPSSLQIVKEQRMKGKETVKIGYELWPKLNFLDLDLSSLTLDKCPELKILFSEIQCTNDLPATSQPLFEQVSSFKRLEELHLVHLGHFEQIWHDEFPITSFCKLRVLSIEKGEKLLKIIPSHALVNLLKLEKLYVQHCDSLKEIFDLDGIMEIKTEELFPKLTDLVLRHLPEMVGIYNKEPVGIPTFRNLRSLRIIHCNSLISIFPASAARGLEKLQEFKVFGCKKMQVVIVDDEKEVKENMIFPDLSCLVLKHLPQLTSFYRGVNTINWPVLKEVRIKAVPIMETFALGSQETPQLTAIYVTFLEKCWKGDLNETIKFLHKSKKWNAATGMVVPEYEATCSHGQIQTISQPFDATVDKMKDGSPTLKPNKDKGKEIMQDP